MVLSVLAILEVGDEDWTGIDVSWATDSSSEEQATNANAIVIPIKLKNAFL